MRMLFLLLAAPGVWAADSHVDATSGLRVVELTDGATPASMLPQDGAVSTIGRLTSTCANR